MKIIATQDYLRGRTRLIAGAGYEVSDKNGWQLIALAAAREATAEDAVTFELLTDDQLGHDAPRPSADGATLDVQDVSIGVTSPQVGVKHG